MSEKIPIDAVNENALTVVNEKLDRLLAWTEKVDKIVKIVWESRPRRDNQK